MLNIVIHVVIIGVITFLLARRWQSVRDMWYWTSWLFHLGAAVAVGLVYQHYYQANDTWVFFSDAQKLSALAKTNFSDYLALLVDFSDEAFLPGIKTGDFRSLIFVKVLSLLCLIDGDNYWVSALYFGLISFVAAWFLFRKATSVWSTNLAAARFAFLFFPSVVFWSSGLEKETLTLASLFFLAGVFVHWYQFRKIPWRYWLPAIVATFLLWALKYYWAGVFFMSMAAAVLVILSGDAKPFVAKYRSAFFIATFVVLGVLVSFLHPNFYLHRFMEVIVDNHGAFVSISADDNLIHYQDPSPTIPSFAMNAPWALFSAVFRPWLGEARGLLGLLAAVENTVIALLMIGCVVRIVRNPRKSWSTLTLALVSYCVVLAIFLALSTPNLGTLSRYRVGFLPFLIYLLSVDNPLLSFLQKNKKD